MALRCRYGHTFFEIWFQERLCGILVNEVKSRVHGAANLTAPMHQYQLHVIPCQSTPTSTSFKAVNSDSAYLFLAPRKCSIDLQFKHLQQYYQTVHKIPSIWDCPDLVHMDDNIDVWNPCFVNNVVLSLWWISTALKGKFISAINKKRWKSICELHWGDKDGKHI